MGGENMLEYWIDSLEAIDYLERQGYILFKSEEEIIDYILQDRELLQMLYQKIKAKRREKYVNDENF
jgi:hypothetical protein